MSNSSTNTRWFNISAVERDTGLSKDILRAWERRYGFPTPSRDSNGERVYPADQLEKLRVIRRLIDSGVRPGSIVSEPLDVLNARIRALPSSVARNDEGPVLVEAQHLLKTHQVVALRQLLSHSLMRLGLLRFVLEVVAPLNELVGNAWIDGRIEIFEEHLYAEQMQQLLRHAIGTMSDTGSGPRVLLTTLPGEQHKIGLLMAEACLSVERARCISLGVQTPVWDIVQAAHAHHADIVALSCSQVTPANVVRANLGDLRSQLDAGIALWCGGSLWQNARKTIPGVKTMATLTEIPAALETWRQNRPAPRPAQ
jgi:MerR family transcriptional regulator, light-induced transcriptional regulator